MNSSWPLMITGKKSVAYRCYPEPIGQATVLYGLHSTFMPFPKLQDAKIAVPSVLSVMRNVSVPFGINTPEKPYISSTRWRSVSDQKNKVYYFESTLTPNLFWLDLKKIDFSPKAGIKKLSLTKGEIYAGDAVKDLKDSNHLLPFRDSGHVICQC